MDNPLHVLRMSLCNDDRLRCPWDCCMWLGPVRQLRVMLDRIEEGGEDGDGAEVLGACELLWERESDAVRPVQVTEGGELRVVGGRAVDGEGGERLFEASGTRQTGGDGRRHGK